MNTRTLGKSGLVVSELALGTFGLAGEASGPADEGEAEKALAKAKDLGINLIDTADLYGAGPNGRTVSSPNGVTITSRGESMEARIGKTLENDREILFCTKGGNDVAASPPRKRFDRIFLHRSAARSADRLRRPPDLYLLHHPTVDTLRKGEAIAALEELMAEGVIRKWGVACGDANVARAAIELGATVIELPYNLFMQRDLHDVAGEIISSNVGVLARSCLAYGLLCGTWPADKTFEEGDHRRDRWTPEELTERLRQVAALRPLVHDEVHTLRSAALRFVLSNQMIGAAVVGVRTAAQLEANVRAIGHGAPYLPEEDLAKVPTLLTAAGAVI